MKIPRIERSPSTNSEMAGEAPGGEHPYGFLQVVCAVFTQLRVQAGCFSLPYLDAVCIPAVPGPEVTSQVLSHTRRFHRQHRGSHTSSLNTLKRWRGWSLPKGLGKPYKTYFNLSEKSLLGPVKGLNPREPGWKFLTCCQ